MLPGDTYELITIPRVEGQSVLKSSDEMRIQFLNKHKDACYIDTDALLLWRPILNKPNTPYLAEYTMDNRPTKMPDVYMMASNGCPEWFSPEKFKKGYKPDGLGYSADFLKSLDGFEYIDLACVAHPYSTSPTITKSPVDNTEFKKKCAVLLEDKLTGVFGVINDMMRTLK
jgi:hypothetical protein